MCIYMINVLMMMSEMESSFSFRVQKPSACTQREGFVMIRWTGLAPWEFEFPFLAPWGERKIPREPAPGKHLPAPLCVFRPVFRASG